LLNHSLPGWRQSLGVAVLLFAGLGLLSNLFRFAGVILASSLWILILFLIGREVLCPELGKPALKTKSAVISSARLNSTEVNLDRGKPARVIEKRSGLRTLEGNWYQTSTFWDRINPFKITGNLFGRLFDWWSGRFNSIAASLEEKLAMSPFKAAQTLEQVRKDINLASGKAEDMLAGEPAPELAHSGLSGDVYYDASPVKRRIRNRVLPKMGGN